MLIEQNEYRREEMNPQDQILADMGFDPNEFKSNGNGGGGEDVDGDNSTTNLDKLNDEQKQEYQRRIQELSDNQDSDEGDDEADELSEEELRLQELQEKGDELSDEEKEELNTLQEELKPTILKLRDSFEYEELKDKEYENTPTGFKSLVNDLAGIEIKNNLQNLHAQNPMLAEFYDHVVNKGLSEELFAFQHRQEDYEQFNLKEESGQEQTLAFLYKQQGMSDDDAKDLIELHKNKGVLDKKAKSAKEILDKAKQEQITQQAEKEQAQREEFEKQSKKIAGEIKTALNKKQVAGYKIPDEDFNSFTGFINDQEAKDKAYSNLTTEQKMLYDYILMKGLKVSGLDVKSTVDQMSFDLDGKNNKSRKSFKGGSFRDGGRQHKKKTDKQLTPDDLRNVKFVVK